MLLYHSWMLALGDMVIDASALPSLLSVFANVTSISNAAIDVNFWCPVQGAVSSAPSSFHFDSYYHADLT